MNMINLKVINFIGGGYSRDKMQTDRQRDINQINNHAKMGACPPLQVECYLTNAANPTEMRLSQVGVAHI